MGQSFITNVSKTCMTHDRRLGSKETNPQKWNGAIYQDDQIEVKTI